MLSKLVTLPLFLLGLAGLALSSHASVAQAASETGSPDHQPVIYQVAEDYCGTDLFDVPDDGESFHFSEACQNHDECYEGVSSPWQRRQCDRQFLADMLASCAADFPQHNRNYYECRFVASVYYAGVRLGGWIVFA